MKKNLHPELFDIEIVDGQGEKIVTKSTVNKNVILSNSKSEHNAWRQIDNTSDTKRKKSSFEVFDF